MYTIQVIEDTENERFVKKINNLLKLGWKLHGAPSISSERAKFTIDGRTVFDTYYMQALKKELCNNEINNI